MTHAATKLYDQAAGTVHDWADTVRGELPDIKDVKKDVKNVAGDLTDRAGDMWEDAADKMMMLLPGAAARAARSRRRRWMFGGIAVIGVALLFGPGGARRRAALKAKMNGALGAEQAQGTGRAISSPNGEHTSSDQSDRANADTA